MLDRNTEWRAFTPEEIRTKARTGPPTSLKRFDKGLSTTFLPYKDTYGKALPMRERFKMMRLLNWNNRARVHYSNERNLSEAMNELNHLSDKLHIPENIVEDAALIYRKALDKDLIRGRSIQSIAAAALYAACRLTQTPRSLKEVAEASTRRRKEISRCYRLLQRELRITMPMDKPEKYVSKIASKVGLNQETQNTAMRLIQEASKRRGVVGKGPSGLAAATLYIAAKMNGKNITQRDLADAAEVTEVTVRNRFKDLDRILELGLTRSALN
jgi:transcription initiation factor TFIIB